eukprot:4601072-Ditylum_brightwellii.AAC.1
MEEVLNVEISEKAVCENILESPYVVDMHKTPYTNDKGIWTIEMAKDTLHQAMSEINKGTEVLQDILPDEYFKKSSLSGLTHNS